LSTVLKVMYASSLSQAVRARTTAWTASISRTGRVDCPIPDRSLAIRSDDLEMSKEVAEDVHKR
jgi:hypothetical protein